jgi:hypothetical protein
MSLILYLYGLNPQDPSILSPLQQEKMSITGCEEGLGRMTNDFNVKIPRYRSADIAAPHSSYLPFRKCATKHDNCIQTPKVI